MADSIRVGILTLSDRASRGEYEDKSGVAIAELLEPLGPQIVEKAIVPDDRDRIESTLRDWVAAGRVDLIVTTGGTGLAPRDVTPEATRSVIEREIPGVAELMRGEGRKQTPYAALSRGIAGVAGRTLIVNLPGSEKGVRESLAPLVELLPHAVDLIRGTSDDHPA